MRRALTYLSFPAVFAGALICGALLYHQGWSKNLTIAMISIGAALLIGFLERVHPYLPEWNRPKDDVRADTTHLVVSMVILPEVLRMGLYLLLLDMAVRLGSIVGYGGWPTDWPLWAQLCLAMVVAEFGSYWAHRLMHEVDWLWRLHATHHSAPRLYWLNAARFHPLDVALQYIGHVIPLILLGCPEVALMLFTIFTSVHGMFQHANIEMRLGPLNWIFSMAELHRWHHSTAIKESNANYGANLIVWDILFGTRFLPADRKPPETIGIADLPHFPMDYLSQIMSPFQWKTQIQQWGSDPDEKTSDPGTNL